MSKQIYVLQDDRNKIKIGITNNLERRIAQLQQAGGFLVTDQYASQKTDLAFQVEALVLAALDEYRIIGEWFDYPFDSACFLIERIIEALNSIACYQSLSSMASKARLCQRKDDVLDSLQKAIALATEEVERIKKITELMDRHNLKTAGEAIRLLAA